MPLFVLGRAPPGRNVSSFWLDSWTVTFSFFTQARVPSPQLGVMSRREDEEDIEASEREPLAGEHNDSPAPPLRCVPLSYERHAEFVLTICLIDQRVRFMP